jgi:hypothetical protein
MSLSLDAYIITLLYFLFVYTTYIHIYTLSLYIYNIIIPGLSSIFGIKSDVLFDYFDDDKSGSIDRKELMLGLSVFLDLYRCTGIRTHATLVYHAFDANGDGVLSIQEFR